MDRTQQLCLNTHRKFDSVSGSLQSSESIMSNSFLRPRMVARYITDTCLILLMISRFPECSRTQLFLSSLMLEVVWFASSLILEAVWFAKASRAVCSVFRLKQLNTKGIFLDNVYFVSSLAAMCKAQTRLAMVTRRSHNRDTQTRKVTQKFSPDIVHYYGYI